MTCEIFRTWVIQKNVPLKTTWQFSRERPRYCPPEEDKHGERPGFILAMSKLFVSLKLHLFALFLHTGCSDLKNIRWIDVFMYVIRFSAVAASIRHGVWKKYEIQTALFSKQSGLPSWKHASRYILKCFFYSMKIKLQNLAGVPVWK